MFQQLSISKRLMVCFSVSALAMLAVMAFSVQQMGVIKSNLASINDVYGMKQRYAINFRGSVHDRAIVLRDVVAIKNDALLAPELATIQRLAATYTESAYKLDALMAAGVGVTPHETELLNTIKATETRTMPLIAQVIALREAQKHDEALALLMTQARPQFVQWLGDINKLIDFEEAQSTADGAVARAVADNFLLLLSGAFAGALALMAWITWRVSLSIVVPLKQATEWTHEVAQGDLSRPIGSVGGASTEIGRMMIALQTMNQGLTQLVGTVRETSIGIASGVREIASGNTDLSQRTEQQVSHLQETHSAMQSFTESLRRSSDMATQARALATTASTSASEGGEVVQSVVQTMNDITLASRKISDIISVIDGIAFQTNILALNAAVEAARAGEQGRGFAVVAGEVRLLAQRSANAAKEIKGLIQASVDRVDAGARLVDSAGQAMSGIVIQVKQVSDLIASISDAAAEQTSSIAVVERSMTNLDHTSQQNSALVEENAASAETLSEQAQQLNGLMAVFRLRDSEGRVYSSPVVNRPTPRKVINTPTVQAQVLYAG